MEEKCFSSKCLARWQPDEGSDKDLHDGRGYTICFLVDDDKTSAPLRSAGQNRLAVHRTWQLYREIGVLGTVPRVLCGRRLD
jgi:hypothetical protein